MLPERWMPMLRQKLAISTVATALTGLAEASAAVRQVSVKGPTPGRRAVLASLAGCGGWHSGRASPADGGDGVDVLLVLAVDVSGSVSSAEARLQRNGYSAALRHPDVLRAIQSGPQGSIGLAYLQWAGVDYQRLIVPWTRIRDLGDAAAWAERMERATTAAQGEAEAAAFPNGPTTSISAGIRLAAAVLQHAPWPAARRVIDISGDGPNNDGPPAETSRDDAIAQGITINGLAIEGDPDVVRELGLDATLESYYRTSVIGGPGAFVVPVRGTETFGNAIRSKMMREIAGIRTREHEVG